MAIAGVLVGGVLQFLLVLMVTHGLDPGSAGIFFEAVAFFSIISITGLLGAEVGIVREVSRLRALDRIHEIGFLLRMALRTVGAVGLMVGIVIFVAAAPLASILFDDAHQTEATKCIRLVALFLPLATVMSVALAATRGFGTVVPHVLIQNIGIPALRPILALLALSAGFGALAITVTWLLPISIGCGVSLLLVRRLVRTYGIQKQPHSAEAMRAATIAFWRFATPRGVASFFGVLVTMLDVLLVGALRSTRDAAVYAAASRLAIVGNFLLQGASRSLAPQFSELTTRREHTRLEHLYQTATWWIIALSWPLYICFAVFSPTFMRIFGQPYRTGATALLILAMACLFDLGTGNMNALLLMAGKSWWNLGNAGVAIALNVSLNLVLIPRLGINGAAIAWAASIVFNNIAELIEIHSLLGLKPFGRGYPVVGLGALGCYGAVGVGLRIILGAELIALVATAAIGTALYLLLLWRHRDILALHELRAGLAPGLVRVRRLVS